MTRIIQIDISAIYSDAEPSVDKQEAIEGMLDNLRERLQRLVPDGSRLSFVVGHKELNAEEMIALAVNGPGR